MAHRATVAPAVGGLLVRPEKRKTGIRQAPTARCPITTRNSTGKYKAGSGATSTSIATVTPFTVLGP